MAKRTTPTTQGGFNAANHDYEQSHMMGHAPGDYVLDDRSGLNDDQS